MNLVQNRTMHPHLRDEEALVIENAIRLAIDSIINVLYSVNSARTHEYQRMVADRDKEIQRLECRAKEIERELQVLRRQGRTCGLFGNEHILDSSHTSNEPQQEEQSSFEPSCIDSEMTTEQECEMSISLGLFARPPSHFSSQSHESAPPSSPSRTGLDRTCTSHSSEVSGVSEGTRNLPASPGNLIVKEEPCDIDTVLIKWEMSEQRFEDCQESAGAPCQDEPSPSVKRRLENRERIKKFREKLYADPDRHHAIKEGERLRNGKRSVPMSELPEEAQRQKRAAWRAASRRYYARKVARQQAGPAHHGPFPHATDSPCLLPVSFVDKRKRTLISELPEATQTVQREAWRVASRRYYARKTSRLQTDPAQLTHLLQNAKPSGETAGPSGGGSHANSGGLGGIMCS
ncbi:uncharacterized protein LOC139917944 [Centroberyx gerrardi]|uniref:uncharacterized protein n=1 Tax=Centroberyx gerrardi TaxID=166262 RepID=UPI003AAB649C